MGKLPFEETTVSGLKCNIHNMIRGAHRRVDGTGVVRDRRIERDATKERKTAQGKMS